MTTITKPSPAALADVWRLMDSLGIFLPLSADRKAVLGHHAALMALKSGQMVFREGEAAQYWFLVLSGQVDTLRFGRHGDELIFRTLTRGSLLAAHVMFVDQPRYPVSARMGKAGLVCRIPRDNLHQLCQQDPQVAVRLLQHAGNIICGALDELESLICDNVEQRLARYFLQLYASQGHSIAIPLPQRLLAQQLGVRVETLNRTLSAWKKQGVLSGGRHHWLVHDVDSLRERYDQ